MRRLALALSLISVMLATAGVARAETADAFVKRANAQLEAARPKSEMVISNVSAIGLKGTITDTRSGDDRVQTTVLGPFTTLRGSSGGQAWHQNENGITVLEAPEPSQTPEPHKNATLTRMHSPRDLWVVTEDLPLGRTERTFYDPRDLVVVREEIVRGSHSVHVDYDDFRMWSGGKRRAWHAKGSDDRGNTYELTVQSDNLAPVIADGTFAVPKDRRTLVEFPEGVNQTKLPATVDFSRVHVTVQIDGNPLTFALDTGASGIVIDDQAAKDLKLARYGSSAMTVAGTFASSKVVAPVVQVGELTMRNVVMTTAPFDEREGNFRVVGLLGFDFIAGAVLRIDYIDPGSVIAIRPNIFTPPLLATSTMPVRLNQQVPVVHVGVGNTASDDMIVDTGAEAPVIFFDRFVKAHPAAMADLGSNVPYDATQIDVGGVGGRIPIQALRIKSFRFADLEFQDYVVLKAQEPGAFGDFRDDGLLGSLFLRFYTVYVDYPDHKLYFEPNENYQRGVGTPLRP